MNLRMMEIDASNAALLSNFLYEAIFVPSGMQPPSRDILADPQLQVYVQDFGKQTGDFGLFAEVEGVIAGAVWARIMEDYGYIDNETPSLAIALYRNIEERVLAMALAAGDVKAVAGEHGYDTGFCFYEFLNGIQPAFIFCVKQTVNLIQIYTVKIVCILWHNMLLYFDIKIIHSF
ncbi:MAG: hypothetical protein ACLTDX_00090 [[Clostridium] innocuum]